MEKEPKKLSFIIIETEEGILWDSVMQGKKKKKWRNSREKENLVAIRKQTMSVIFRWNFNPSTWSF